VGLPSNQRLPGLEERGLFPQLVKLCVIEVDVGLLSHDFNRGAELRKIPLMHDDGIPRSAFAAKVGEGLARKTLSKYDHCIRLVNELASGLGLSRIHQLTPSFMDKFRAKRVEILSKKPGRDGQKTATNDLVTIREIVNYALERKLIVSDPLAGFVIKKAKTKPQPYWVQEELDCILAAATRQPHADVFRLLAWTGMRIGEVEHLYIGRISTSTTASSRFKPRRVGGQRPGTHDRFRCHQRFSKF
jgi:hypothetical protein